MAQVAAFLNEGVGLTPALSSVLVRPMALSETINAHDTAVALATYRASVLETLRLIPSTGVGSVLTGVLAAQILLRDAALSGLSLTLRESLRIGAAMTAQQTAVLTEALKIVAAQAVQAHYSKAIAETFQVRAFTAFGLAAFLRESLEIRPTLTAAYRAIVNLSEELEIADVLTPKLILVAVASETVVLTGAETLQALYQGTLQDGVDFIVDTVDPSGDITTWAVNVRTGAVSQYLNYGFRSFAQSANGLYLGAADDGLYELSGPDDNGTPVIADMISGLAEFSGAHLSSIKAAYLAVRGDGEFFLKLTEGTGRNATYRVLAQSLRTARVDIGKGLRARFFTFELVSTGQEFDLASLTFIPIQQTRRV